MEKYDYEILNYWNDYEDLYVDYIVSYNDGIEQAHACSLFSVYDISSFESGNQNSIKKELLEKLIQNNGKELSYPKTSELNQVTYDIFKELCQSDNNMLYIEDEDDFERLNINRDTYKLLCDDIKKFDLKNYFGEEFLKITVYGGLQCCFNDDREERNDCLER